MLGSAFVLGSVFTFTLLTVKILAVAAAPAHALTVGLVKLAVIASVIPFKKAFLYALHRKVKTEVLAVNRYISVAAKGRSHPELAHHGVAEIILHIGVVLNNVVETKLVEAVIGVGAVIMIEFDFKAVTVVAVIRNVC